MHALAINFVQRRRIASPLGLFLLVAGIAAMGVVGLDYVDARDELDRVALRQARLKPTVATARQLTAAATPVRADAKAMDIAAAQLSLPWDAVLREVESRANPAVALLSIEAQAQARTLRISGEAKTMADAVAYVSHLRESPLLTAVYLSGHDEKQAGAVTVVQFSLDAKWSSL